MRGLLGEAWGLAWSPAGSYHRPRRRPSPPPGMVRWANTMAADALKPSHFIRDAVLEDLQTGRFGGQVHTRFPPEPNGYLHIGHAKSICLNFGLAEKYGGKCNLRYDDTNPTKEEQEYVDSIIARRALARLRLGRAPFYASDYFEQLYDVGREAHRGGQGVRRRPDGRGDPRVPRRPDQGREGEPVPRPLGGGEPRPVRAHAGGRVPRRRAHAAGEDRHGRRATSTCAIPIMYRILHATHHRTGDKWCIYPMYDWAHGQSDSIEGITHSICTLEFEIHRPLYDWYRRGARHLPPAADRVRAAEPHVHAC